MLSRYLQLKIPLCINRRYASLQTDPHPKIEVSSVRVSVSCYSLILSTMPVFRICLNIRWGTAHPIAAKKGSAAKIGKIVNLPSKNQNIFSKTLFIG